MKIAAILTCFNRKNKTLQSLRCLYAAYQVVKSTVSLSVYLTDDGCTDGTADAVRLEFPDVNILKGTGTLFWAGGMRNSWIEAIKNKYDIYLLLNDDTNVTMNIFTEMLSTHEFSVNHYGKGGIYIGSTKDLKTNLLSYGGGIIKNKFLFTYKHLLPNGKIQECNLGNGNIMFISHNVIETIGILSESYRHAIADYDYTLTAKKHNIPVLITPNYCGECCNDNPDAYEEFKILSLTKRISFLKSPIGFAFSDNLKFMKKHFPYRLPIVYFIGWFKVLFPKLYISINKLRLLY